jgi:hypothetical protein
MGREVSEAEAWLCSKKRLDQLAEVIGHVPHCQSRHQLALTEKASQVNNMELYFLVNQDLFAKANVNIIQKKKLSP